MFLEEFQDGGAGQLFVGVVGAGDGGHLPFEIGVEARGFFLGGFEIRVAAFEARAPLLFGIGGFLRSSESRFLSGTA